MTNFIDPNSTRSESDARAAPLVSVVVCTRDRPELLRACLESLEQLDYPNYEIVIVDNAPSDDATRRAVEGKRVKYVVEAIPGLSRGRNHGVRASTGEVVAFTDDDCVVDVGWLRALVAEFADENVACVTGPVRAGALETQTQQVLEKFSRREQQGQRRIVFSRNDPNWFVSIHSLQAGSGANMALRKSFVEKHGSFDETVGAGTPVPGGMENGMFFSVLKHGFKLVHTPEAIVYHNEPTEMPDLKKKLLEGMTAQTAYLTQLFFTERGYRFKTLQLAFRQFGKFVRAVKTDGGQTGCAAGVSLTEELWALARGPWRYLTCRRQAAKMRRKIS